MIRKELLQNFHKIAKYLMDSKTMFTRTWIVSFVFLMLVNGSTLNVIDSAAITTTAKSFASTPTVIATITTPSISEAPTTKTTKILSATSEESFTTTLPTQTMTLYNASIAFNIHSISSKAVGFATAEPEKAAKSSIIELIKGPKVMKQIDEIVTKKAAISIGGLQLGAEFATTKSRETLLATRQANSVETKATKSEPRVSQLSESSTQVTTQSQKRTKTSINGTQTVGKMTGGRSSTGTREDQIAARSFDLTKVAKPTAEKSGLSSTLNDVTTIASRAAATSAPSTTTLLATKHLASTPRDEYIQNITNSIQNFRADSSHNNKEYNYSYNETEGEFESEDGYDKNKRKIDSVSNSKHINSSYQQRREIQQRQTHPLQRPKVQTSNNDNNNNSSINNNKNNYNYLYNSNSNYFSNQQNAHGNLLLLQGALKQELRPQYARQVQQQQNYHLAAMMPLAASATTAAIFPSFGNSLISDKYSKQNEPNSSKPTAIKNENRKGSELHFSPIASNISLTTMTAKSGSSVVGFAAVTLDDRTVANTSTKVSAFPTVTTTTIKSTTRRPSPTTTPRPTPSIDDYQTVISQAGTHAYLPCNVKQLVKKPISWLRVRDGHILTVDQTTFIADQRFQSIYAPNPERWSLQIKYVQLKDEGTYECQVSTEPKSSAIVTLRVVEPRTELIGEPTRHVKAGSQVKLRCIISQALEPPLFINWFHNQKQIYLHSRRGWRTEIERIELPLTEPSTTATTTTTTAKTTTFSTKPTTKEPTTREEIEDVTTTMLAQTDAEAVAATTSPTSAATRTLHLLPTDFDSFSDTLSGDADKEMRQQAPGVGTVSGKGSMTFAKTTATIALVSATSLTSFTVGFGNGSTTSPTLAAMAPAAVTIPTALPTVTKTMRWPTTTSTTSTTLAAVEVRQITTASLIIPSVEKQDSGNYTCSPSNSAPKTVVLHVLNGEYSASAITSGVNSRFIVGDFCKWHIALLTLFIQNWHHTLIALLCLMKFIASSLKRYILLRVQLVVLIKPDEIISSVLDIVATAINYQQIANPRCPRRKRKKILSFCYVQIQSDTCHLTFGWSYENKFNKSGTTLIDHRCTRWESNDKNCDDLCRNVGLRVDKALHLLATKEKT